MKLSDNVLENRFAYLTLILLTSIVFGYFIGNLIFGFWITYIFYFSFKTKTFSPSKKKYPMILFSTLFFLSVLWTADRQETVSGIMRQLPLFFFAVSPLFLPKISTELVKRIFLLFSIFMSLLSFVFIVLAVFKFIKYGYLGFLFYHELVSPLDLNAIYVSYIVSFCFIYLIQEINRSNVWVVLPIIMLGIFLLMLASKMILFITLVLTLIVLIVKIKQKLFKVISLSLFALFIAFTLLKPNPIINRFIAEFNTSFQSILNDRKFEKGRVYTGLEARLLQLRLFNEIINEPKEYIIGVGLDGTKGELKELHKQLNTPERFQTYNFHNQYLQIFSELGFVGLSLFIIVLVISFCKSRKQHLFFPFVILSIFLFFSESVIWRQRGIMFFGVIYVLLMNIKIENESK